MEPSTAAFVDFLEDRARAIGPDALAAATTLVLDVLGVAVAGSATPEGQIVGDVMLATGRAGGIAVPGKVKGYDPTAAALVTGTAAYSIGLTDTHSRSITHPGPSVVAAALAVGQAVGASGEEVLRAVVLGCEAVARIGAVVNPSHRRRGFHPTATCNPFGAAFAASHLLKADRQHTLWALGLAGSTSGGLYEFRHQGDMLMALHGGLPAANGAMAAYLAAADFTGPATVLEGPEGFFRAYADEIQPNELLVSHPSYAVQELSLRPYCACRYAHAAIDGIRLLSSAEGPVDPDEIAHVTVFTHRVSVEQETAPVSIVGARLSTRFNVALALVHWPRVSEVPPNDLRDRKVTDVADRITIEEDPRLTAMFPQHWACRVRIETRDGRVLERQVESPWGDPDNPMSPGEVDDKFMRLAAPVIGPASAENLMVSVRSLDRATDLQDVVHAMTSVQVTP